MKKKSRRPVPLLWQMPHCQFCEIAVLSPAGKVVQRDRCETTIPALVDALAKVPHPCSVVSEEGPMASWLWRNLHAQGGCSA